MRNIPHRLVIFAIAARATVACGPVGTDAPPASDVADDVPAVSASAPAALRDAGPPLRGSVAGVFPPAWKVGDRWAVRNCFASGEGFWPDYFAVVEATEERFRVVRIGAPSWPYYLLEFHRKPFYQAAIFTLTPASKEQEKPWELDALQPTNRKTRLAGGWDSFSEPTLPSPTHIARGSAQREEYRFLPQRVPPAESAFLGSGAKVPKRDPELILYDEPWREAPLTAAQRRSSSPEAHAVDGGVAFWGWTYYPARFWRTGEPWPVTIWSAAHGGPHRARCDSPIRNADGSVFQWDQVGDIPLVELLPYVERARIPDEAVDPTAPDWPPPARGTPEETPFGAPALGRVCDLAPAYCRGRRPADGEAIVTDPAYLDGPSGEVP